MAAFAGPLITADGRFGKSSQQFRVWRRSPTLNALGELPGLSGRQDAEEQETAMGGRSSRESAIR